MLEEPRCCPGAALRPVVALLFPNVPPPSSPSLNLAVFVHVQQQTKFSVGEFTDCPVFEGLYRFCQVLLLAVLECLWCGVVCLSTRRVSVLA